MMNGQFNKIFIIGFNKCGTRTLNQFFRKNGLRGIHGDGGRLASAMISNLLEGRDILDGYDDRFTVYSDMIFISEEACIEGNSLFRVMDKHYPGSAFILNLRDVESWIKSRSKHRDGRFLAKTRALIGPADDEAIFAHWRMQWQQHVEQVERYFAGRENLLTFDIVKDSPQAIADFLGIQMDLTHYGWEGRTSPPASS